MLEQNTNNGAPQLMSQLRAVPALRGRIAALERHARPAAVPRALSFGEAALDGRFAGAGLAYGAHEAAGAAGEATSAVLFALLMLARLFRACPDRPALVVQEADALSEGGALYGPGLHALGLDPGRLALVRARDGAQALRMVDEAVRSGSVCAVVAELRGGARRLDLPFTQRLNVHGQQTSTLALLLTPGLEGTSAALSRWRTRPAPSRAPRRFLGPPALELELTRNRHGRTGRWTVEWSCDDEAFRLAPAVDSSLVLGAPLRPPVVSSPGDRSGSPGRVTGPAPGAGGDAEERLAAHGGR